VEKKLAKITNLEYDEATKFILFNEALEYSDWQTIMAKSLPRNLIPLDAAVKLVIQWIRPNDGYLKQKMFHMGIKGLDIVGKNPVRYGITHAGVICGKAYIHWTNSSLVTVRELKHLAIKDCAFVVTLTSRYQQVFTDEVVSL
jgi:hypothetical protein